MSLKILSIDVDLFLEQGARDVVECAAGTRVNAHCCFVCLLDDEAENIMRRFGPHRAIELLRFEE